MRRISHPFAGDARPSLAGARWCRTSSRHPVDRPGGQRFLRTSNPCTERGQNVGSRLRGRGGTAGRRPPCSRKTQLHRLECARADDGLLGRQPAAGTDHGRLRSGLRLSLRPSRDHLPDPHGVGLGRARVRLVGRRVPLGHRGHLAEHGFRRRLAPVRHDDLLLPDLAVLRGQHAGLRDLSRVGLQRGLDGRGDHLGLLVRHASGAARWHRCDRQARLQRRPDRDPDPGRPAGDPGHHLPGAGQPVGRTDDGRSTCCRPGPGSRASC